jgi:predicted MFS family arabinose efflux permease
MDADPDPARQDRISRAEWGLILVLVAVQFTHMVDFVIIMPLGERLMRELAITPNQFGHIVSAYALAAGFASLAASFVMDRFDRRTVLLTMYAGFGVSTLLCGLADGYETLLAARTAAGVCGGLAAVALMTVIGDVFPPHKRGRASGAVMSAFAVASIAGLPIGLELAARFGRGVPFYVLAGLSAGIWLVAWLRLPNVRGHLASPRRDVIAEFTAVAREPNHLSAFAFSFFLVLGSFTVGSFMGPYLSTLNGWTERELAVLYAVAGVCTLVTMNVTGRFADRVKRLPLFRVLGAVTLVLAVVSTNLPRTSLALAAVVVSLFMVFASARMVPAQAMLLGAAAPRVRGSFLSLNTSVQHLATGLAPMIAGAILTTAADGTLVGFPLVGWVAAGTAAVSLVLAGFIRPAPADAAVRAVEPRQPAAAAEPEPKPAAV